MFPLNTRSRKVIHWLLFALLVGIGLLLIREPTPKPTPEIKQAKPGAVTAPIALEEELVRMLSVIDGVGTVDVLLTWEDTGRIELAENRVQESRTTEEQDNAGGLRIITDERWTSSPIILRSDQGRSEGPLVLTEHAPRVRGVLIVAEGAGSASTRFQITRAVEAALQIASYRIEVLPRTTQGR